MPDALPSTLPPPMRVDLTGWTDDAIAALRALWAAGWTGGQIALHLHTGKNSVVGKVHRLGLPSRPSPIVVGGRKPAEATPRKPVPRGGVVLPRAPSKSPWGTFSDRPPQPAPAPRPAASFLKPLSPERACRMPQWPDKAGREHADYGRFCDAPTVAGTSWCLACLRRVAAPSLRSVVPQLAATA